MQTSSPVPPHSLTRTIPDSGLTAYIVPAFSDQAGQCRIVVAAGHIANARDSYRNYPKLWSEAGLMNSQGRLVCCEPLGDLVEQLKDCEPLVAGLQFRVSAS